MSVIKKHQFFIHGIDSLQWVNGIGNFQSEYGTHDRTGIRCRFSQTYITLKIVKFARQQRRELSQLENQAKLDRE